MRARGPSRRMNEMGDTPGAATSFPLIILRTGLSRYLSFLRRCLDLPLKNVTLMDNGSVIVTDPKIEILSCELKDTLGLA